MKRNTIHALLMAALLPLAILSCTRESLPGTPDTGGVCPLSITVTDGGYGAADGQTKATENGYRTEFTAGDKVGLYIVRGGTAVYNNVKLTATAGADGSLTWQPEASVALAGGFPDECYFLYYPYQSDMSGKTTVSSTDAEGFFAPLVSGWQPKADQSTYANYTASDLMTAKGTATKGTDGSLKLSFSMSHRMALAVIEMPPTVYKFTNATSIPDYTVASSAGFTDSSVKPYGISPGKYRCIVTPAISTATSITGSYDNGMKEFTITPSGLVAGNCKTYKIDGAAATLKSYTLQPGDYFCKSTDGSWYIIPGETAPDGNVIGIVFHAGQHSNDKSDYSQSGIGQKKCHGYAVALKDANAQDCMWGGYGTELGCYPTDAAGNKQNNYSNPDIDWNGYAWTQKIITAAGGKGNLNASDKAGYPATWYAVVSYEEKVQAPSKSSGWFLPSIGQMWKIYQNRSSLFGSISGAEGLRSNWYWSSSERYLYPAYDALRVDVYRGDVGYYSKYYSSRCYVRPILAF